MRSPYGHVLDRDSHVEESAVVLMAADMRHGDSPIALMAEFRLRNALPPQRQEEDRRERSTVLPNLNVAAPADENGSR